MIPPYAAHYGARLRVYPERGPWLADRTAAALSGALGASDLVLALGIRVHDRSPHELVEAARGLTPERTLGADAANGLGAEDYLRAWWERRTSVATWAPLSRLQSERYPWLWVSIDAFTADGGLLEIKAPVMGTITERTERDGETVEESYRWPYRDHVIERASREAVRILPPHVLAQVYAQLEASGAPWCDVVVGHGFQSVAVVRVAADPTYQRHMLDRAGEWVQRHLIDGEPLPVDDSSACRRVLIAHQELDGHREATPEEVDLAEAYRQASAAEKAAGIERKTISNTLTAGSGGYRKLTLPGGGSVSITKRGVRVNGRVREESP